MYYSVAYMYIEIGKECWKNVVDNYAFCVHIGAIQVFVIIAIVVIHILRMSESDYMNG